jgi:hypothetical protein
MAGGLGSRLGGVFSGRAQWELPRYKAGRGGLLAMPQSGEGGSARVVTRKPMARRNFQWRRLAPMRTETRVIRL